MARPGACEICSAFWVTGLGRAETLGVSDEFMADPDDSDFGAVRFVFRLSHDLEQRECHTMT